MYPNHIYQQTFLKFEGVKTCRFWNYMFPSTLSMKTLDRTQKRKGEQERDKEAAESAIHKEKGKDNSCNTCFKWVVVGAEEWCWGSKEPHDKGKNASYK